MSSSNSVELARFKSGDIAREFDNGGLQAETQAQKRHAVFARIANRGDFAFDAAHAKTAGHNNRVHAAEFFGDIIAQAFGVDPFDFDFGFVFDAAVFERFNHRNISVGLRQRVPYICRKWRL